MKKNFLLTIFLLLFTLISSAQIIVEKDNNRITIRNIKGDLISQAYYDNVKDVIGGNTMIYLWYDLGDSGKIEVRNERLKLISSNYYSKIKKINMSGDYIIIFYMNGKIETRDYKLKLKSSIYK